ncbi:glycosyltransferase family 2 protein [Aspergillus candidus]|uniref:Nucleotide-diphospho-sugar transferase n=1 Tax=Aspergillus candidus TaxID=41067 RepID=A0A2I2FA97_ASPCN|nr:nucleotide-diphospho-sugar transferase [Aspergillus candidus]PLB37561.1 nucleotide-diphospho-sugar transferase [Aspergillus candidus]
MSSSHTVTAPRIEKSGYCEDHGPYRIEKIPNLGTFPLDSPVVVGAHILTWVFYIAYLAWRVRSTWSLSVPNDSVWRFLWLNILVEMMTLVPEFVSRMEISLHIAFGRKPVHRDSYHLRGEVAPSVDVYITCCGEDLDVIMDTVAGAASQDYPRDSFRVFLLDDAKCPEVQDAVERFNRRRSRNFQRVIYLGRTKTPGIPHNYKAGNIRFGLAEGARRNGSAEYMAALDADMIPAKDWLRRIVPHLLLDKQVAMAVPPQRFYNTPDDDILAQDTKVFSRLTEPINDSLGGTSCTGSGYVLRRSALDSIGGWPLQNAAEDIVCAWMLTGQGWHIVFVKDEVQFGLAPGSLAALFKQRARWTDGNILAYQRLGWFLSGTDLRSQRTMLQRIICLCHVVKTYMAIPNSITIMLVPWVLCPVEWPKYMAPDTSRRAMHQIYLVLLMATLLQKWCFIGMHEEVSIKAAKRLQATKFWNMPLNVTRIVRSWIPGNAVGFDITGTVVSSVNERSERHRKPIWVRLLNPTVLMYAGWILYALVPLAFRLRFYAAGESRQLVSPSPAAVAFFFSAIMKLSIPVQYMARPPTVPDRRHLLKKGLDGVYRVSESSKTDSLVQAKVSWKDVAEISIILFVGWRGF